MREYAVLVLLTIAMSSSACAEDKRWNMADERYSCYTSDMTLQELASGGVTVVSHTPATKEYCDEAHKWGLKVCPYVSLYKVIDSTKGPDLLREPFWKEVDASQHPEWYLRREDGEIRRPFEEPNYPAPYQQSCCNHQNLVEAYERGVRNVMAIGADGVFVDNVHPYPKCYGPKLGLHTHEWPDKDNTECYKMALRKVYEAVKSFGPDRVVILNSGGPSPAYVGYGDSLMWESFIWRSGFADDAGPLAKVRRWEPRTWEATLAAYSRWRPYIEQGASIAPLTYLADKNTEEENAFFAYACARLCGFDQWTATCGKRRDILRRLYRVRTGRPGVRKASAPPGARKASAPPVSELIDEGAVAYRLFENAIIVCNHSAQAAAATIPLKPGMQRPPVELFDMKEVEVENGKVSLRLPPESGRVIVGRADAFEDLLREVEGQALAARLYVEKTVAERGGDGSAAGLTQQLGRVQERAAAYLKDVRNPTFPEPVHVDALCSLSSTMPAFGESAPSETVEGRLLKNSGAFSRDEILRLLNLPDAAAPTIEIGENSVTARSSGTVLRLAPEDRRLILVGSKGLELWVAPPPAEKGARWLHASRLTDVKVAVDEPDRKRVEGRIALRWKTDAEVKTIHAEFAVEARRGSPLVALDLRIVNDAEPYTCYAFLSTGFSWQTDPAKGTVRAAEAPDLRQVEWVYLHREKGGGDGLLFTRAPAVGKSGGGSYIFGSPKNQALAKGAAFDLGITVATLSPPLASDRFLLERLENMRRHASLAAGLCTGFGISLEDAPKMIAPGDALHVPLRPFSARPGTTGRIIRCGLRAVLDGHELTVVSPGPKDERGFEIAVPADAAPFAGIDLFGECEMELGNGTRFKLRTLKTVEVVEPVEIENRFTAPPERPGEARVGVRLRSTVARPVSVKAQLELPGGWKVADPDREWTVPPNGTADVILRVSAPPGSANAQAQGMLSILVPPRPGIRIPYLVKVCPSVAAPRSAAPPKLDGVLDDPCWQGVTALSGFVNHKDASPVKEGTTAHVTCGDKAVYVAVRCSESRMDQLRETVVEDGTRTSPEVPQDDSVEVYVGPNMEAGRFVRFAVSCANAHKSEAHGRWESAVKKGAHEWCVELVLPYEAIGAKPPRPGEAWGFNVCRNEQRLKEFSCWSCTYGAYAQPDRFGWVLFSDQKGK